MITDQDHEDLGCIRIAELAELWQISESSIARGIRQGTIPAVRLGGRYLIPRAFIRQATRDAMAAVTST